MRFADRTEAGKLLAGELGRFTGQRPVVLALARGGVPVGYEIALALHAPLEVLLVRKIRLPWQPELALGAIVDGEEPGRVIDEDMVRRLSIPQFYIDEEVRRQRREIERRRQLYGRGRSPISLKGATAILVDDGIATGASMQVALRSVRRRHPAHLVLAVPVAAQDSLLSLRDEADQVVCLDVPENFGAVGQFYDDFHDVKDAEVIALLQKAHYGAD